MTLLALPAAAGGCSALRGHVDTKAVELALSGGCDAIVARLVEQLEEWNGQAVVQYRPDDPVSGTPAVLLCRRAP